MILNWIALNSVHGLGPARIKLLLDAFQTPSEVFRQSTASLRSVIPLHGATLESLRSPDLLRNAEEQIARAESLDIRICTIDQPAYPSILREIYAPPPVLYMRGVSEAFSATAIAFVGTRRPTSYGRQATGHLVRELCRHKTTVVSGLATGIDTTAHICTLDNGRYTIAVLGHGIDMIYPRSNRELADRIAAQGALVSEFPLGTQPEPWNFPRRNRIISGLSQGVVVVEAGEKSGSLITANFALQQNRDVFAVPGPIFSSQSRGTFQLIAGGAVPVRDAADIIEHLRAPMHAAVREVLRPAPSTPPLSLLSQAEHKLYEQLPPEPLRMDQIADCTGASITTLFDLLLGLELKGFLKQVSGQQYLKL